MTLLLALPLALAADPAQEPAAGAQTVAFDGHTLSFTAPPEWGAVQGAALPPEHGDELGDHVLARFGFAAAPGMRVEVHRYDERQVDDPGVAEGDLGETRQAKEAAIRAFASLYSGRSPAAIVTREDGDALGKVEVLVPRALFWLPLNTMLTVHAAEAVANRAADLRGALVLGTVGQDYGFQPSVWAWVGSPTSRLVVTLVLPVDQRPELAAIHALGETDAGFAAVLPAGNAYLASVLRTPRTDGMGAVVTQVEGFVGSLVLR